MIKNRGWITILVTAFIVALSISGVLAQRTYTAVQITGKAPRIDGKTDAVWDAAPWSGHFTQYEPYNGKEPTQQTAFKIMYDNNNLYVLIRCYDTEPDKIERRLTRRDNFQGDWVAIGIDSYNDDLTAFAFSANAAGVKGDVKFSNDDKMDITWDAKWYLKTTVDSLGWLAEMKIPFTQLRFSKSAAHKWGVQVIRAVFRNQETSVWNPVSKELSGWVSHFGVLDGINNINPKKEVELIPYVMGSLTTEEKEEGNPFKTGQSWNYSAGLDGKIAVTNDLTLNFTVNPDFGQVEADPSEVNLTAFETYFQEKRPFFIEGNNIFNFPLGAGNNPYNRENLFYSRRIGRSPHYYPVTGENEYVKENNRTRILGAFKLSGKTKNGWSIGVMESITNRETALIDSLVTRRKETVEPLTNYFNTRIQKDLNNGNTLIGGMVTATNRFINDNTLEFLPAAAYTGGMDFTQYWKNRAYRFSAKAIGSHLEGTTEAITQLQEAPQRYYQRPDMPKEVDTTLRVLQGTAGSAEIAKIGQGHWRYGVKGLWLSPGLELNDQGYLRAADVVKLTSWIGYQIWEPFSVFRKMNIEMGQWSGWDSWLTNTWNGGNFSFWTQLKNYWAVSLRTHVSSYSLNRHVLRGGPSILEPGSVNLKLSLRTNNTKKFFIGLSYNFGKGFQDVKKSWGMGVKLTYQPVPSLNLSVEPGYNTSFSKLIYVKTFNKDDDNALYLTSSIKKEVFRMDVRINFSLTPDLSIQYWGQPFFFSGDYSGFKKVVNPKQKQFDDQFHLYQGDEIWYDETSSTYYIDDNGNGNADYSFGNPDFSLTDFRSNFVARWEYTPGAALYLVWSQTLSNYDGNGIFDFNDHLELFGDGKPVNVFLIKFSYRLSM